MEQIRVSPNPWALLEVNNTAWDLKYCSLQCISHEQSPEQTAPAAIMQTLLAVSS